MNIYQSKNLAVFTLSRFTIEGIQPATGLSRLIQPVTPGGGGVTGYQVG